MKKLIVLLFMLCAATAFGGDYGFDQEAFEADLERVLRNSRQNFALNYRDYISGVTSRPTTYHQIIKQWAQNGLICEALGHCWEIIPVLTLSAYDYNPPQKRKCKICGKCEERRMGEWK